VWKLIARESGDPASTLPKGKRKQGGVDEGEPEESTLKRTGSRMV
jgi:hypothetical protein